jgi:putative transposase
MESARRRDYLHRLSEAHYTGYAFVHWSMTIEKRRQGWLNQEFHAGFREQILHTLARYRLVCPVYCLMPDHLHLFWIGLNAQSHQLNAVRFARTHLNRLLKRTGFQLQKQGHDNVLRPKDRARGAVRKLIYYIAENPVRAGLVKEAAEWLFSGSLAAGYPDMDWRRSDFERRLWAIYERAAAVVSDPVAELRSNSDSPDETESEI